MTREFFHEDKLMFYLSVTVCMAKRDMYNLQQMLMHSFPDLAHEFLIREEGALVESAGDALLVRRCVEQYHIGALFGTRRGMGHVSGYFRYYFIPPQHLK